MAKPPDDLEAVRLVATALEGFGADEQERIIRWAREKLGLGLSPRSSAETRGLPQTPAPAGHRPVESASPPPSQSAAAGVKDLKTFVAVKNPNSDVQFAATVAYFYRFEAPPGQQKSEIEASTLQDACRLVGRKRLQKPAQTLRNAKNLGLLDSGSEAGRFTINTVGENLVAMTLPSKSGTTKAYKKPRKAARKTRKNKK